MTIKERAFSVIEMLVAITIFILISGIVIVRFDNSQKSGRDSVRIKDLGEIANALENYYTKNNDYPSTLNSLVPTFLGKVPVDPLNQSPYVYSYCRYDGKYALMARLETKNQALQSDYDKDWPSDAGATPCYCSPGSTTEDPENTAPYTYCIKNP